MTQRKRAGEPDAPWGAAGAPEEPVGPAGAPQEDPPRHPVDRETDHPAQPDAGASERQGGSGERERAGAEDSAGDDVERKAVEHDIDELLDEARKERDEYLELAQRTKADFENYRRRASREAEEAERRAKSGLARQLVPVLDNLERALRAAGVDPDAAEEDDGDGGGLTHGVRLVYRDLKAVVEHAGVETYDPAGERFDPEWHEALATRPTDDGEPGIVLETVEKGYRLDGQVLRPARVIVSAGA
jgi:molecular chaperone GrpE